MGRMGYCYNRRGNPITLNEWGSLFADADRRVRLTTVGDAEVSTVWMGIDHRFVGDGPPLIFETMIFGGEHGESQWRWSTEEQAVRGHRAIVDALLDGTPLP